MKYFVTIYIDPLFDFEGFTHAFLGLTKGKSPDELDKIKLQRDVKYWDYSLGKMVTFRREEYKWYESLETNEYNDGFWGFGTANGDLGIVGEAVGKVFENNQYVVSANKEKNVYDGERLRSKQTFLASNRCVFEVSQEQYQKLLGDIRKDFSLTANIKPLTQQYVDYSLRYDIKTNNCVTWVLNKLDSIGIEIIDSKEWLPDNISTRDSLLRKFHYLQYLYAVFRKFQKIDSNLESIAGAKAFRTWARSMTQNKIFCALKIEGDITKGLDISTECKRTITQNQKYYENKLKDFITKSSDFMRVYNRINEQLERLLTKVKNLGYTNIQGDFTFIMWNDELQTRMLLDSKHRDKHTKDYIAYPIEQIDPNIPACNWTLNHNASFILILRDEMLCRAVYKNYHYSNMSESFIDSINKSHIAILSGNDDLSYWSKSLHALRKSVVCEE